MAHTKKSSLPAVLKEYLADYEPRASSKKVGNAAHGEAKSESKASQKVSSDIGPNDVTRADAGTQRKEDPRPSEAKSVRKSAPRLPSRERSVILQKKQEKEKNKRNFENWQQLKEDSRDEKGEHFQEKILLQQELIRRQDELYEEHRRREQQAIAKKREEEKAARLAREEELRGICKQSLAEDRQRLAERRAARQKHVQKSAENAGRDEGSKQDHSLTRQALSNLPRRSILTQTMPHHSASPPDGILREATEEFYAEVCKEEEQTGKNRNDIPEEIPWHHDQLYQLLGGDADYFLHPKFEENTPRLTRSVPESLQLQTGGARQLWTTLRKDSRKKLLQQDNRIPDDLKAAYSAFVRQLLGRRQKPIRRNYYAKEDVPDMEQLLDQSKTQGIHEFRHKMELMSRSSRINQDRSRVMLFNNALPNINDLEGLESCVRYMPSWLDTCSDTSSELSYKKWLGDSPDMLPQIPETADRHGASKGLQHTVVPPSDEFKKSKLSETHPEGSTSPPSQEWAFLSVAQQSKRPHKPLKQKLHFLTEEAARCEPEFSKKRKELEEANARPKGYSSLVKAHSVLGIVTDREDERPTDRSQSMMSQRQLSNAWEPLSLMALAEYKGTKGAQGSGRFAQGSTAMWPVGCGST